MGNRGKGGFISRIQGNKGKILREKGEQRRYCIFVPLFAPGEQGNRYPLGVCWLKGKFGFNHANSEGSGALAYVSEPKPHVLAQMFFKLFNTSREVYVETAHLLDRVWAFVTVRKSRAGSNGDLILVCESSEGSGESAHLHSLTLAFVTVPKYHELPQTEICVLFTPAAKALASLHICTGSPEPRHSNEKSCAGSNGNLCAIYASSVDSV